LRNADMYIDQKFDYPLYNHKILKLLKKMSF
jgi:hypothetical protein